VNPVPLQPVKRSYIWLLWIGIAVAVIAAFLLARQGDDFLTRNGRSPGVTVTASGLQFETLTAGKGAHPTDSDVALINYEGKLLDGTTFDKSQQPTPMPLKGVVPGFSEALKLMSKGAKFRVWMPAKLGYGEKGAGPIPANANLVFDIELIDFLPQSVIEQYQLRMMQSMGGAAGAGGVPGGAPGGPDAIPGGEPGAPDGGNAAAPAPAGK
jgi:FKBP-type peptidyl-prolyl cis-trans isomerase FkpA